GQRERRGRLPGAGALLRRKLGIELREPRPPGPCRIGGQSRPLAAGADLAGPVRGLAHRRGALRVGSPRGRHANRSTARRRERIMLAASRRPAVSGRLAAFSVIATLALAGT